MRRNRLVAGAVAALLVTVFAAVRVFAPGDTLDRIRGPFPPSVAVEGRVYGELMHAPLLVGTRMRVYGAQNRVWADGPLDMDAPASALWALRRWPAQLVGVVADDRIVVSKWSDGELVAIDPDTGRIAWRAEGGVDATAYAGRRTGADTVYEPPGLYLASATVISAQQDGELTAFDTGTGKPLWHKPFSDRPVGRQGCTGVAGPGGGWLIGEDGGFAPAPYLTGPGVRLAGDLVVHLLDGHVVAHDARTGAPAWSWPGSGTVPAGTQIVATEPRLVHVVTPDGNLFNLESQTGLERSGYPANVINGHKPWVPGHVYAANGFVAIERVLPGGRPDQKDSQYYYPFPTVLLTGS